MDCDVTRSPHRMSWRTKGFVAMRASCIKRSNSDYRPMLINQLQSVKFVWVGNHNVCKWLPECARTELLWVGNTQRGWMSSTLVFGTRTITMEASSGSHWTSYVGSNRLVIVPWSRLVCDGEMPVWKWRETDLWQEGIIASAVLKTTTNKELWFAWEHTLAL